MKNGLRAGLITVVVGTVVVVSVVSVALLVYLYTTVDQDARQNVRTEAITVLMQLVAIVLIGGLVTGALTERSREKDRRSAAKQHKEERQDALNEFRRSAVTRVVTATNVVRKAPILIESDSSWETYDEQAKALLDVRLDLGLLHHDVRSVGEAFTKSEEVAGEIEERMERYLQWIVKEWSDYRKELRRRKIWRKRPGAAWKEISKLPALADLLNRDNEMSLFQRKYKVGHENALALMRKDIFRPDDQNGSQRPA